MTAGPQTINGGDQLWGTLLSRAIQALQDGWIYDDSVNLATGAVTTRATWATNTTFTVSGDATGFYTASRRLKVVHAGGTTYCPITSSSYNGGTGLTTVTIGTQTSGPATMTAPISSVSVGFSDPTMTTGNDGAAPSGASYVTTAAESGLSAEKVLGTSVLMAGTLAGRPAASVAGYHYFATDDNGGTVYRDTGVAWNQITSGVTHASRHNAGGADAMAADQAAGTASLRTLGTGAAQAAAGNHSHPLTTASAFLTLDVTLSVAGIFFDGPSVSLAAGTWVVLIGGTIYRGLGPNNNWVMCLYDGSTTYVQGEFSDDGGSATSSQSNMLAAIVTLGGTTTLKLQVALDSSPGTLKAAQRLYSQGNFSTWIAALKVA